MDAPILLLFSLINSASPLQLIGLAIVATVAFGFLVLLWEMISG